MPLLIENIRLQFDGGADVVMVFDTAAGELRAGRRSPTRHRAGPRRAGPRVSRAARVLREGAHSRRICAASAGTRRRRGPASASTALGSGARRCARDRPRLRAGQFRSGALAAARRRDLDRDDRRSSSRRCRALDAGRDAAAGSAAWATACCPARRRSSVRRFVERRSGELCSDTSRLICSRNTTCRCRATRAIRRCRSGTTRRRRDAWLASLDAAIGRAGRDALASTCTCRSASRSARSAAATR